MVFCQSKKGSPIVIQILMFRLVHKFGGSFKILWSLTEQDVHQKDIIINNQNYLTFYDKVGPWKFHNTAHFNVNRKSVLSILCSPDNWKPVPLRRFIVRVSSPAGKYNLSWSVFHRCLPQHCTLEAVTCTMVIFRRLCPKIQKVYSPKPKGTRYKGVYWNIKLVWWIPRNRAWNR